MYFPIRLIDEEMNSFKFLFPSSNSNFVLHLLFYGENRELVFNGIKKNFIINM